MRKFLAALSALLIEANAVYAGSPAQTKLVIDQPFKSAFGASISLSIPSTTFEPAGTGGAIAFTGALPDINMTPLIDGWTADLTISNTTPYAQTFNNPPYNVGTDTAPNVQLNVTAPGYDSNGNPTTVPVTIWARSPMRQAYSSAGTASTYSLPVEAGVGSTTKVALTLSDIVYSTDVINSVTVGQGLYTGGNSQTNNWSSPAKSNGSAVAYHQPICNWVTEPGLTVGHTWSTSITVELFCAAGYGANGAPVGAVKFTAQQGSNVVTKTVSALTASTRQWSTTCTATHGSATLTSCGNTFGLFIGDRINVVAGSSIPAAQGAQTFKITPLVGNGFTPGSSSIPMGTQSEPMTPTAAGLIQYTTSAGSVPLGNEVLADGVVAGTTITAAANLSPSLTATAVAPVGTGSTSGASTTITLGAPASGQWAVGQYVSGTNIPAGDYIASFVSGTNGGAGNYTLGVASSGTVSGNVTGSIIGILNGSTAGQASTSVTKVSISNTSTSGTASATTAVINDVWQGSTGTVVVTKGPPIPVYSASFSYSDLNGASFTKGAIQIRAQVYPHRGDPTSVLDSQGNCDTTSCQHPATPSQAQRYASWEPYLTINNGQGCEFWFENVNSGVCNTNSAAYFADNGQQLTANFHNQWHYFDADDSYKPIYCFINSATGTSTSSNLSTGACSATATTPSVGCTSLCAASPFALLTAIKASNNNGTNSWSRGTAHNDLNGVVFCYMAAGSPVQGFGGQIDTSVTKFAPGVTHTSALATAACPAPHVYGGDPTGVTFGHNATNCTGGTPTGCKVSNMLIENATISDTARIFDGSDPASLTAFPAFSAVFDGDKFVAGATTGLIPAIGAWWIYNSNVDESQFNGNFTGACSGCTGAAVAVVGSTLSGGGALSLAPITTYLGDSMSQRVPNPAGSLGLAPLTSATGYQPDGTILAYDWIMNTGSAIIYNTQISNLAMVNNVFEANFNVDALMKLLADGTVDDGDNLIFQYNSTAGERDNLNYADGAQFRSSPTFGTTSGSLTGGAGWAYFVQPVAICIQSGGPSPCASNNTTETSTDGTFNVSATSSTSTGSIPVILPCHSYYGYNLYIGGSSSGAVSPTHPATVASATTVSGGTITNGDALNMASCQEVRITATSSTSKTPPAGNGTYPSPVVTRSGFFFSYNMFSKYDIKGDAVSQVSPANWASGSRLGDWQQRFTVNMVGNVTQTQSANNTTVGPNSWYGDLVPYLGFYSSNTVPNFTDVQWSIDRSFSYGTSVGGFVQYPGFGLGWGDYCPVVSTSNYLGRVPASANPYGWDIWGITRYPGGPNAYAGAYENGCA